jgi:hypothetical protein
MTCVVSATLINFFITATKMRAQAAELVRLKPDVIVGAATPAWDAGLVWELLDLAPRAPRGFFVVAWRLFFFFTPRRDLGLSRGRAALGPFAATCIASGPACVPVLSHDLDRLSR